MHNIHKKCNILFILATVTFPCVEKNKISSFKKIHELKVHLAQSNDVPKFSKIILHMKLILNIEQYHHCLWGGGNACALTQDRLQSLRKVLSVET